WATNPASVYIAEIAHPKVRMSLNQLAPSYASLGLIFGYISGYYISWRIISWITILVVIIPVIGICFLHESPPWLMLKGRYDQARKSLNFFHKNQPQPPGMEESFAELQFKMLKKQQEEIERRRKKMNNILGIAKEFLKPTGYKPILIMTPLFFCQEFSGIFITMFYSITFIEAVHIELVSSLSTEAFLLTLKIFIARRGIPKIVYSDNASNFLGACNQLKKLNDFFMGGDVLPTVKEFNIN
ncbi:trehalose transporter 1-like protein, partial [Diabrotica undecimpunctata]|uniref:trehalose transporter 1-like protein n=1 Tax=Diabrotica undecimpunctata TaxID=50387 RepID=UPI003B633E68